MAITNIKRQEETANNTAPVASKTPYTGLQGVSQNTAANLGNYQQGYKPSEKVTNFENTLSGILASKPQGYQSKYGAQMDNILAKIAGEKDFDYSLADDKNFRYYADLYTNLGRQASLDTMGQAAALTGGYGNSYAQNAANQRYQQYLMRLYEQAPGFEQNAMNRWQMNQANRQDQLAALQGADATDYGRYRDAVGDWEGERDYYTNRVDTASAMDYDQYAADRDYWTGLAAQENQDYWTGENQKLNYAQLEEEQRQFDASLSEQQRQDNRDYAYGLAAQMLSMGQMPSDAVLVAAGISAEDAAKLRVQMEEPVAVSSGGGYTSGKNNNDDTKKENTDTKMPTPKDLSFLDSNLLISSRSDKGVPAGNPITDYDYNQKNQKIKRATMA